MGFTASDPGSKFDHRRFLDLEGSDLVAYMEPLVNDPTSEADPADLRQILDGLDRFDEYHLVYAIEFATERMPDLFARAIVGHLADRSQSVRLAVHRALSRLPAGSIGDELVAACREAVAQATAAEMGDLPAILEARRAEPALPR